MDDRSHIANVIGSLAVHVDGRQWNQLLALFAPRVGVDYTSLVGGEAQAMTREDLIGGLENFFPASRGPATSSACLSSRSAAPLPGRPPLSWPGTS
jgi:hypothetical protein